MLSLIRCPFHPRVTAVARHRPRSFCQKCRWQVTPKHAYTLDPTKSERADYAAVQAQCGSLSGNELTHNSSGNTQPQSSQLAEPLWTDPGLKSGICVCEESSNKKIKKSTGADEWSNILPKFSQARKKPRYATKRSGERVRRLCVCVCVSRSRGREEAQRGHRPGSCPPGHIVMDLICPRTRE